MDASEVRIERSDEPGQPVLVAIGGLSGTGKSTLGRLLAPILGGARRALHLRSDQIRKRLAGIGDLDRLPADAYTLEAARAVYEVVRETAKTTLVAGRSVVVDTVAARADERSAFAEIASVTGARFIGLWLEAPEDVLIARVTTRTGDASDADTRVVRQQRGYQTGDIDWVRIDASGSAEETFASALKAIALETPISP